MSDSVIKLQDVSVAEKWQQILADLVTDPKELLQILGLDPAQAGVDPGVLEAFPLKVPRPFLSRIEKGNWRDPLLRQILPLDRELSDVSDLSSPDPLDESHSNPLPGLLHKYHGRVLLTVAPHCAIHCRYCFRRHFDYAGNTPGRRAWHDVLDYIRDDASISEVIFSGGDPLAAGDRLLSWLAGELAQIPHLKRLRVHTRTPIVIPQRVTVSLVNWLTATRLDTVLVLHCNHAREIDAAVAEALGTLKAVGLTLLNQSVLLKGVNDNVETLCELSETLFAQGVLPYYLHLLDPVSGVGHFDVPESHGRALVEQMRDRLPGYLVPRLAREQAGAGAKLIVT